MSKDMAYYEKPFEWQQFPEGRARFAGGIRGWDEHGHEVYAVEFQGRIVYDEIDSVFLPNHYDYNIEVVSFGYGMEENVEIPEPTSRGAYTEAELETIRTWTFKRVSTDLRNTDDTDERTRSPGAVYTVVRISDGDATRPFTEMQSDNRCIPHSTDNAARNERTT